jgi:hypothetical protein
MLRPVKRHHDASDQTTSATHASAHLDERELV